MAIRKPGLGFGNQLGFGNPQNAIRKLSAVGFGNLFLCIWKLPLSDSETGNPRFGNWLADSETVLEIRKPEFGNRDSGSRIRKPGFGNR